MYDLTDYNIWRKAAKARYSNDGEVEIDDDASVSIGIGTPQGAYVQAWVWVPMT